MSPPLTGRLYVTSWFGGVISVVDLASGQLRETIPAGVQNHNVYLAPDSKTAWVTNHNDGTVTVLDTASNAVLSTIPIGVGPRHTFFSPDGAEAYVTAEFDNTVVVIDSQTRSVSRRIAVGHMPHFAIVAGDHLFLTNFGSADVTVVRRDDGRVVGTVPVALPAAAQSASAPTRRVGRIGGWARPVSDGRVDDAIWGNVGPHSGFVQQEPFAGEPATERTERPGSRFPSRPFATQWGEPDVGCQRDAEHQAQERTGVPARGAGRAMPIR